MAVKVATAGAGHAQGPRKAQGAGVESRQDKDVERGGQPLAPALAWSIDDDHALQLALCRDLEALADGLPALPSLPRLRRLTNRLGHCQRCILPRAELALAGDRKFAACTAQRSLDTIHCDDLVAALWDRAADRVPPDHGQLAYMLRCFFDGRRRAIALERALIGLPPIEPA